MKTLKISLALSLAALAALALADDPAKGRSFSYVGTDAVAQDYSAGGATFKLRTKVTVTPYLYVSGNMGAAWSVTGWGAGEDAKSETISVLHNETISFVASDFGDLLKTDGTKTGSQSIAMQNQFLFYVGDATDKPLYDTGMLPAKSFNGTWGPVSAGDTGGKFRVVNVRKITLDPGVGPGTYENVATLTFSRN